MANRLLITCETRCFFLFRKSHFFAKKILLHVHWLGFLNATRFYLVFFLRKLFLLIRVRPGKLYFPLYTSLKITRKCFVFHTWIYLDNDTDCAIQILFACLDQNTQIKTQKFVMNISWRESSVLLD